MPDDVGRLAWVHDVDRPALVLGSTQSDDVVDRAACRSAGVEVVRRRSGGGAVLLVPGEVLWVDLVVPAGDRLWDDDVGRAAGWIGRAWAGALAEAGHPGALEVHDGALACGPWGRLVCFAGVGPGEVTAGEAKLVGVSQRRTRAWARFQCAALARWDPEAIARLLVVDDRSALADDLARRAAPVDVDLDALLEHLLAHLPT